MSQTIAERIKQLRRGLLVNRVMYYCFDYNIMPDEKYDIYNAELNKLEAEYPDIAKEVEYDNISPNRSVGSSVIEDYPLEIIRTAEYLMNRNKEVYR